MMSESIVGRHVKFRFASSPDVGGRVISMPAATGDCWIVQETFDGKPTAVKYYIQSFEFMILYPLPPLEAP